MTINAYMVMLGSYGYLYHKVTHPSPMDELTAIRDELITMADKKHPKISEMSMEELEKFNKENEAERERLRQIIKKLNK